MMRKGAFFFSVLVVVLCIIPAPCLFAQRQQVASLEGLTTIHARVQLRVESAAGASGIRVEQLQADAERQLTDVGLKVVANDEFNRLAESRGYPIALFDLDTRIYQPKDIDFVIYYISLRVRQVAYVARRPVIKFLAPTWELTDVGTANDAAQVKDMVKQTVGMFISDFKAENPK